MKKVLLPFLFSLIGFTANAQRNFHPGYIIQKNDTIQGLIDQRGDKRSAEKVNFKKTADGPVEIYTPSEIQGYGILQGPKFEVKRLIKGNSSQDHFLTLLVKGNASLYSYRDADTNDHFYLLHGDSLQELISYSQTEVVNGKKVLVPYNLYRGTLNQAFKGCTNEMAGTKNLAFTQKALIGIVTRYNQCSMPASLTYVETPKKAVISWGVAVGGSTSTLTVEGGPTPPKKDQTYSSSLGPVAGLSLNVSLPWVNLKLSLQGEIQYTRHQYNKSFSEQQNTFRKDYEVFFDLPYVKFPLLLRYTLPYKKIKPFVNAGIVNSYAFKYKQELTTTNSNSVQENATVKKEPFMEDFRNYAQSYAIGGGVLFPAWTNHQFSLEGRYEKGNGFSRYTGIPSTTNQFFLLLGLTL